MIPSIKAISDYWVINSNIPETELNFDWADAHTNCWNCGDNKKSKSSNKVYLERCHIIPKSLGGSNLPKNFVLLCNKCHKEAPDILNEYYIWDWIRNNKQKVTFENCYRVIKQLERFKKERGSSFFEGVNNIDLLNQSISIAKNKITTHNFHVSDETYHYFLIEVLRIYNLKNDNTNTNGRNKTATKRTCGTIGAD